MDNTVAVVSIVAGATVGALGIIVTGLGGWRDRVAQREAATITRRAEAYVDLLETASHVAQWAESMHPLLTSANDPPGPELPAPSMQARAFAETDAYASKAVHQAYKEWRDTVDALMKADLEVNLRSQARHENPGVFEEYTDVNAAVHDFRMKRLPEERSALDAMKRAIAAETGNR